MKHAFVLAGLLAATTAQAEEYTLFNPVPDDKMRTLNTERPSKTDSTTTLDAGHFQIESSFVNYTANDDCIAGTCSKSREWDLGAVTTLRIGLTESSDFQIITDAYRDLHVSNKTAGTRNAFQGMGDTTLRYKYNFWGNDGGDSALATLVYVKMPTNQDDLGNDDVEGGIEFPFVFTLNNGWSVGGMTQLNILNEQGTARDYYLGYVNSLIATKSLTERTSAYGEFYTFLPDTGERDWQNTVDFGVVHRLNDRVQLDTGVNFGVSDAAADVQWFAGIAYRF